MAFVDLWNLDAAAADAFAQRYWDAADERLAEFFAWSGLPPASGSRESLVAAMGWAVDWWLAGGRDAEGGEYPMWYLPPAPGRREPFHAPALRAADALGYLWLAYVDAQLPGLQRGICEEESMSFHKPAVWLGAGNRACPFDHGYARMLDIRKDRPAGSVQLAGRDRELLAAGADSWIASRRAEARALTAERAQPEPPALLGDQRIDAELERLGLSWPLHTVHVDEERNAGAGEGDREELNLVFDDIASHEYEQEIDALVACLERLDDVENAERADREYVVVELRLGVSAGHARATIDAAASDFIRAALTRRDA